MVVFLVIGLVLIAPLARAQEATESATPASITAQVDKVFEKWDKPNSPG